MDYGRRTTPVNELEMASRFKRQRGEGEVEDGRQELPRLSVHVVVRESKS